MASLFCDVKSADPPSLIYPRKALNIAKKPREVGLLLYPSFFTCFTRFLQLFMNTLSDVTNTLQKAYNAMQAYPHLPATTSHTGGVVLSSEFSDSQFNAFVHRLNSTTKEQAVGRIKVNVECTALLVIAMLKV